MKKTDKERRQREETKAWIVAYNNFNLLIIGATAIAGIAFFLFQILGYDVSAFFRKPDESRRQESKMHVLR